MNAHDESAWKLIFGIVVLLVFMGIGIGHMIRPDYFLRHYPLRRGGDLLTEWNRTGFQLVGLLVILFSGGILYELAKDLLTK